MKRSIYISLHVLFWGLMLAGSVRDFQLGFVKDNYTGQSVVASGLSPFWFGLIISAAYQAVFMVAFYTAYAWLAPYLFPRIRFWKALLALLAALTATVLARYVLEFHLLKPFLKFDNYFGRPLEIWPYAKNCIFVSDQYYLFGLLLYFLVTSKSIHQEKTQAELSFLKSQINPHFLFNTINDIYALTYQKSDLAPEALLKLSGILRYTLYEGTTDRVSLEKELGYLKDYLDLQSLGTKQHTYIDYSVEGDVSSVQIAPLLLIPFAENIIKHGITDDTGRRARLDVRVEGDHFTLSAVNAVHGRKKDKTGGIGLSNVRRRLELLYPHQHHFSIIQNGGTFECHLDIQLKS